MPSTIPTELDLTIFMSNTLMTKFRYIPDMEDASDAPILSTLNEDRLEFIL